MLRYDHRFKIFQARLLLSDCDKILFLNLAYLYILRIKGCNHFVREALDYGTKLGNILIEVLFNLGGFGMHLCSLLFDTGLKVF